MNTYKEANETLSNRQSRKLQNNTYLQRRGENIAVLLHETDVVTYLPDGSCVLDSGGWRTVTTKARMNDYAPCWIFSDKGVWFVSDGRWDSEKRHPYGDGFRIGPRGGLHPPVGVSEKKTRVLRKQVKDYAAAFEAAFLAGNVPIPSARDCWFCGMVDKEGKPWGDKEKTHYLEHIEEEYFVPSLLYNAMKSAGMGPFYFQEWARGSQGEKPFLSFSWVARAVRRYLYLQMGI